MYTDKRVVSHLDKHQLAGTLYDIKYVAALLIRPRKVTQIYIDHLKFVHGILMD